MPPKLEGTNRPLCKATAKRFSGSRVDEAIDEGNGTRGTPRSGFEPEHPARQAGIIDR